MGKSGIKAKQGCWERVNREWMIVEVRSLKSQGLSQRDMAARLRISLGLVNKLVEDGEVLLE